MQVTPLPQFNNDTNLHVTPKGAIALQVGDVVHATVLTVTETAVAVRMRNTILEARTDLPLKQGEEINLLVEEAGQHVRLRVIRRDEGESAALPGAIRNTLETTLAALKDLKPAAEDIKTLASLLAAASPQLKQETPGMAVLERMLRTPDMISDGTLKDAVGDSGIFFETKLRLIAMRNDGQQVETDGALKTLLTSDMKAGLLELKTALGNADVAARFTREGISPDLLAGAVNNLLQNTEALQMQSRLNGSLQVFIPFVWQDLKDGELVFRESAPDQFGNQSASCTVNLDLEQAGKVSARILLQGGRVYVDLLAANERFSELLSRSASALDSQLNSAGLLVGGLTIRHDEAMEIKPAHPGKLNIRI